MGSAKAIPLDGEPIMDSGLNWNTELPSEAVDTAIVDTGKDVFNCPVRVGVIGVAGVVEGVVLLTMLPGLIGGVGVVAMFQNLFGETMSSFLFFLAGLYCQSVL